MWFLIQLFTLSPLLIARKNSWKEKKESHKDNTNGGFNSFSFSLMFWNPNRATGGGALESTKNATIDSGECLSDYIEVKAELFIIGD